MMYFILTIGGVATSQNVITSPEQYFGFQLGADREIARWDKIVDYFYLLEKESDNIRVTDLGPSTEGNPFLLVIISSAQNLTNLDRFKEINAKISDPRGIKETAITQLVKEGKAVICQSMSLHATEIGGTQMAPELAYDLVSRQDDETQRILDNVLYFMFPSFNPDGQIMVTDWYRKYVGTEFEGGSMPWLYHKYAGHDNNRDGDYLNLVESKYAAKIIYVDWPPQAYIDHHHMGSYGARLYVPPYCEPIRPYADPLIWREISWYGAHIAYKLEEKGKQGILNAAQYPGWGHFGWHWITPFHNIAGMLTESASTKVASPLYIHPEQLSAGGRAFPEYEAQSTFPSPWPGGWWRLRDIVEQKKISAWALLDLAARNKETVLWNAYLKAKRQTERGENSEVKAIVIPKTQHDQLTAVKMMNILLKSGLEIKKAREDFTADGRIFQKGSFLITLAQPKMGLIRNLLMETHYADNAWTRDRDGLPLRPYDLSTHTMHEFMGVNAVPVSGEPDGIFDILKENEPVAGSVSQEGRGYVLDGRMNASYRAVNLLLDKDVRIKRVDRSGETYRPGDFILTKGALEVLAEVAAETGVDFNALQEIPTDGIHDVERGRLGMYHRYWGGNMDEGWTRLMLEQFDFPYTSLKDPEIKKGGLNKTYEVILLPSDSPNMITGEFPAQYRQRMSDYPKEYQSGIGREGVENLKQFVKDGGTLVALAQATEFAINEFELAVRNVMSGYSSDEFFCPGSTIKVKFDNENPLAYGMPDAGVVLYTASPAFEINRGSHNERYNTVVRYVDKNLLQSGWLIGENKLAKKAGMVCAHYGKGQVILIGFRTQNRAQTDGTFKLLFNAIIK